MVRAFVERKTGLSGESEVGAGTLFSSGLIAGGSLMGLLYAWIQPFDKVRAFFGWPASHLPTSWTQGSLLGLLTFLVVCGLLYRSARSAPDQLASRQ
jgi:hypothetical protein